MATLAEALQRSSVQASSKRFCMTTIDLSRIILPMTTAFLPLLGLAISHGSSGMLRPGWHQRLVCCLLPLLLLMPLRLLLLLLLPL